MLQLIGIILISWLLIWFFTKGNLTVLGLTPTTERLKYFLILFIVSNIISASSFLLRMYIAQEVYVLTPSLTISSVLLETWYQFRSVLTEELICRGALLYILIKKAGAKPTRDIIINLLSCFNVLKEIESFGKSKFSPRD